GYSYNPFTHFFVVLDSRRFFYRQSRLLPLVAAARIRWFVLTPTPRCGCSSFCLLRLPSPLVSQPVPLVYAAVVAVFC
uniref:Uncharacterized protein n=1 Tax=Anopheles funestus TaxID=62324 RepID=A0A182S194_ANOFN